MKVNIRGKENVKLSQEARGYITSKVEALEKLFNKSENLIANVLCKGYEKYTVVSKKEKETEEAEKFYCSKKKNKKETKGENNFIVTENLTESIVEKTDDIVMDNEEIDE